MLDRLNDTVAKSVFGRYFKLANSGASKARDTKFTTELRAGLATFVTMAYIISVNAIIITDSGGPCICTPAANATGPAAVCVGNPVYEACLSTVKRDLITATAAASCLATAAMGIFANLPLGLAPGMGANAYFAYTVVGFHGTGKISYETATAAIFMEGLIFVVLTIFGIRQWLAKIIPNSIKIATGAGIGLFLCFIGLQRSAGIGLVAYDSATFVTLGGCPEQYLDQNGSCTSHHMENPTTWLGILGFLIISIMLLYRVKGSVLWGILFVSVVSWFRNSEVTYFPETTQGNSRYDFFRKVVSFHPIEKTLGAMHFDYDNRDVWVALITFLYVDILDTTGTLYSMAKFSGFMDETGDFEGSTAAFICDASSISVGAVFGTSPVTAFIESGAGITEGGRTGITALTISAFFFISLFFAPIFASIPPWATGPALVIIGSMMAKSIKDVNWEYIGDSIPSFLTIAIMPLTYSIAYGLIAGISSYIIINTFAWLLEKVSGGYIKHDRSFKEPWGEFMVGPGGEGMLPPWLVGVTYKIRGIERKTEVHENNNKTEKDEVTVNVEESNNTVE
ncbi:7611_t:CDS:2 [Acaulospora morrowiae]|uniref:7611_t:CDS:1 n=1 Tax=Acaulospora morrowiae TaxID=94023 RepID=A0A9N8VTY5_9GLOM|nr:7611_t:CDS:2 [Acaulospora morrowiae]